MRGMQKDTGWGFLGESYEPLWFGEVRRDPSRSKDALRMTAFNLYASSFAQDDNVIQTTTKNRQLQMRNAGVPPLRRQKRRLRSG
jgi:hypothetical protein